MNGINTIGYEVPKNSRIPPTSSPMPDPIQIDRRHRLLHVPPNHWTVTQIQPNGAYAPIDEWIGGRRSVVRWCAANGLALSVAAETALDAIPETGGFRDR